MRRPWPDRLARRDRPLGPGSAGRRRRPVTCAGRAAEHAEGLWRAGRGQRLAAGGGSASSGSLTQAEKTGSPGQPPGAGLGSGSRGSGRRRRLRRRDARSVRWPRGYWPGSARSHLGSPPGVDWSCTFCVAVIMHVRSGAFRVIRGPRAVSGAFVDVSRARNSPATHPPTA